MGAVSVNVYNVQLMSMADYSTIQQLKKLYKQYDNLYELAECGDSVAASIYIDLKTALNTAGLTEIQRECIILHLIHRLSLEEVSVRFGNTKGAVKQSVNSGLKRILKELGEVSDNKEDRN